MGIPCAFFVAFIQAVRSCLHKFFRFDGGKNNVCQHITVAWLLIKTFPTYMGIVP